MQIALCDDDPNSLSILENYIRHFAGMRHQEIKTDCFTNGGDLLAKAKMPSTGADHKALYDIIFMDIYLTSGNAGAEGIDIIRKLNLSQKQPVVFTTTSKDHAIEAFGMNAVHYLVKPLTQEQVTEALERCIERMGRGLSRTLHVRTRQGTMLIPEENIIYIEVFNKVSHIQTSKNCIQTYASLDSLFELLDEKTFMRPQRSFIVNMNYIREYFFDHLVLSNGKTITLSRNSRAELKEKYQSFLFDLARRGEI